MCTICHPWRVSWVAGSPQGLDERRNEMMHESVPVTITGNALTQTTVSGIPRGYVNDRGRINLPYGDDPINYTTGVALGVAVASHAWWLARVGLTYQARTVTAGRHYGYSWQVATRDGSSADPLLDTSYDSARQLIDALDITHRALSNLAYVKPDAMRLVAQDVCEWHALGAMARHYGRTPSKAQWQVMRNRLSTVAYALDPDSETAGRLYAAWSGTRANAGVRVLSLVDSVLGGQS